MRTDSKKFVRLVQTAAGPLRISILAFIFAIRAPQAFAHTCFVDARAGNDRGDGTEAAPFSSIAKAVSQIAESNHPEGVTLKLAPGTYTLTGRIALAAGSPEELQTPYSIEAKIMPDDAGWNPAKMPVIQSVDGNNTGADAGLSDPHCIAFLVSRSHVAFRGLKFVGDPDPSVRYYYPIYRDDERLRGLEVTQCIFAAEKNSSAIQSGVAASGADVRVDHDVFHDCRNGLVLLSKLSDIKITKSVFYGAYESAIWMGPCPPESFEFRGNVAANNFAFLLRTSLRPAGGATQEFPIQPAYTFADSIIVGSTLFSGYLDSTGAYHPDEKAHLVEDHLQRTGTVALSETDGRGVPFDDLQPASSSDAAKLGAGIFKTPRQQ